MVLIGMNQLQEFLAVLNYQTTWIRELLTDHHCKENDLLVVPGSMFSDRMTSWVRVAWSIEPEPFKLAIHALDKSLDSALN